MKLDVKKVSQKIEKSESKKAMPFVQTLKKKLEGGESQDTVFSRKLLFDEVKVLTEMIPGLKATVAKLTHVDVVVVDENGKTGTKTSADGSKEEVEVGQIAASAEPGNPNFEFVNISS